MRRSHLLAFVSVLVAVAVWVAYGYLVSTLGSERVAYATLLQDEAMKETRERAVARVRSGVRDTRDERSALEEMLSVDVIRAVSTVEAVGEATRASVKIDGATGGPANEHVRSILVSVTLTGTRAAVIDALTVLETLPFPAIIEHVDMLASPEGKDAWTARLRLRFITTSAIGA